MIGLCLFLYICGAGATAAFLDEGGDIEWKSWQPLLLLIWPFLIVFIAIGVGIELDWIRRKKKLNKKIGDK